MKCYFNFTILLLFFSTRIFADIYGEDGNNYLNFDKGKSGYIKMIGLDSDNPKDKTVFSEYPELYDSRINVAIFDSGFYSNHEELSKLKSSSTKGEHGTLVAGIIMAKSGNDKGFRGIVNPKNIYGFSINDITSRWGKYPYQRLKNYIKHSCRYFQVINISQTLSPKGYSETKRKFNIFRHISIMKEYRKVFSKCSKTLFVLAAGNNKVDAKKNNGAIHYTWDYRRNREKYSPLSNVIVVSGHNGGDSRGRYKSTWDYGKSVDIYTYDRLTGPRSVVRGRSKYFTSSVSGSSSTAPQVTGVAAIISDISGYKYRPDKVKRALTNSGQKTYRFSGYRRPLLNAYTIIHDIKG